MNSFKITIFKGHSIIKDKNNIILIDTGAPSTIHNTENLSFLTDTYNCTTDYLGLTIDDISEMLGMEITTLLGVDIISNYKIMLNYRKKIADFDKNDIIFDGTEILISSFMGIPIIELIINGEKLNFFLDTGAKLSYLPDTITNNYESIGTEEDFYPGVGSFETKYYEILTKVDQSEFKVKYGNLPEILQITLSLAGIDGILGYDFFNNFNVMLDLKNNRLKYKKHID